MFISQHHDMNFTSAKQVEWKLVSEWNGNDIEDVPDTFSEKATNSNPQIAGSLLSFVGYGGC